jgi:phytanoyl-CoA hydroxylase
LPEDKGNGIREKGLAEVEDNEEFVMGEVKKGSLVLIHGNVLHKSERNLSSRSRFIYTFHVSTLGGYNGALGGDG